MNKLTGNAQSARAMLQDEKPLTAGEYRRGQIAAKSAITKAVNKAVAMAQDGGMSASVKFEAHRRMRVLAQISKLSLRAVQTYVKDYRDEQDIEALVELWKNGSVRIDRNRYMMHRGLLACGEAEFNKYCCCLKRYVEAFGGSPITTRIEFYRWYAQVQEMEVVRRDAKRLNDERKKMEEMVASGRVCKSKRRVFVSFNENGKGEKALQVGRYEMERRC